MVQKTAASGTHTGTGAGDAAFGRKFLYIVTGGDGVVSVQCSLDDSAYATLEAGITESSARIVGPFPTNIYVRGNCTTHTTGTLTYNIIPYPSGLIGD